MKGRIEKALEESIRLRQAMLADSVASIEAVGRAIAGALKSGGTLYLMGNGGSAADAQHVAAELVGRFKKNRRALPAIALTTDSSVLTSIGNDFDFGDVFVRQVEAFVRTGDVVVGISTSGSSENVLSAMAAARKRGALCIGLAGEGGGRLKGLVDHCLCVPSRDTARIQECHITIGHIVCDMVEAALFEEK